MEKPSRRFGQVTALAELVEEPGAGQGLSESEKRLIGRNRAGLQPDRQDRGVVRDQQARRAERALRFRHRMWSAETHGTDQRFDRLAGGAAGAQQEGAGA